MDSPGALTIELFWKGRLIYESEAYGGGGVGFFTGHAARQLGIEGMDKDPGRLGAAVGHVVFTLTFFWRKTAVFDPDSAAN